MATFAVNDDGTGLSKVYIASESDVVINNLPSALTNSISFVRVVPWIWVTKKGFGKQNVDNDFYNVLSPKGSWFYDWGLSRNSTMEMEYATMSWGKTSLDTPTKRNTVINKKKITHIMSFNEADDCTGQKNGNNTTSIDSTSQVIEKKEITQNIEPIRIDTFSTFPNEIVGCSCLFSNDSTEFEQGKYIYMNDYAEISFMKINGILTKFTQTKFKQKDKNTTVEKFISDKYDLTIEVKRGKQNGYESRLQSGTIKLNDKKGNTITISFYGECCC